MQDGLCACGTCFVPGYQEALEHVNGGLVPLFTVEPDGIYMSAYVPTVRELAVFTHEAERVRASGHVAVMAHVRTQR